MWQEGVLSQHLPETHGKYHGISQVTLYSERDLKAGGFTKVYSFNGWLRRHLNQY
jgi:hypothetical protein